MGNINKYQEQEIKRKEKDHEKDSTINKNKSEIFINNESKIDQASLTQDKASITNEINQIILEITLEAL